MAYSAYSHLPPEYEACDVCSTQTLDLELLPCTHLVCVRCFEEAAVSGGSSTGCIICDSSLPPRPPHSSLSTIPQSFSCHLCTDDVLAIAYCTNCSVYLCEFCEQAHIRQKRTANHRVVLLEDTTVTTYSEPREYISDRRPQPEPLPSCPHFNPNQLSGGFYCESCVLCICTQCKEAESHYDHVIISMNDLSLHCFEKLQNLLSKTQPLVSTLKDSVHTIDTLMATVEDKIEQTSEDVCQVIEEHITALEEHRISLLSELEQVKKHKLHVLSRQMSTLTHALNSIHSACAETSHVLSRENDDLPNSLTAKLTLAQKLQELTDKRYDYRPQEDDYVHFQPFVPVGRRKGFQVHGLIDTRAPSASNSTITRPNDAPPTTTTDQPTVLILTAYDKEGTRKINGGDFVELRVTGPSGSVIKSQIIDVGDGSYKLVFNPPLPGEYKASLMLGNRYVQGSPYMVSVIGSPSTQKQHSGVFHCCSYCTTNGRMDLKCQCGGNMPGKENGGCGHDFPGHPGCRHWSCCGSTEEESICSSKST